MQDLKNLVNRTQGMQFVSSKSKGFQIKVSAFKQVKDEDKPRRKAERFPFSMEGYHKGVEWKLNLETAWEQGKIFIKESGKEVTLNEIINITLEDPEGWLNVTDTHKDNSIARCHYFQKIVGTNRKLSSIDRKELKEYLKHLLQLRVGRLKLPLTNGTINQYMLSISKLFTVAKLNDLISDIPSIPKPPKGGGKPKRCLLYDTDDNNNVIVDEEGEFYRWCETLGGIWLEYKMIMQLGIHTAMRRAEIAMAQCDWINLRNSTIKIPAEDSTTGFRSKNGIARNFKFDAQSRAIIKYFLNGRIGKQQLCLSHYPAEMRREKERNFGKFEWNKNKFTKYFNQLKEKAGIDDLNLTFHSTRHTAITRAIESPDAPSAPLIQKWVGHAKLSTTLSYYTANEKHVDGVVNAIANHPASLRNSSGEASTPDTIYKPLHTRGQWRQKAVK